VCEFGATGDEANLKKRYGYDEDIIANKILKVLKK